MLLIDADLRRPAVAAALGLATSPGLTDVLSSDQLDLAAVALGSIALIAAVVGLRPRCSRARRTVAVVGALAFGFHTIVLDGLLWPVLTILAR